MVVVIVLVMVADAVMANLFSFEIKISFFHLHFKSKDICITTK